MKKHFLILTLLITSLAYAQVDQVKNIKLSGVTEDATADSLLVWNGPTSPLRFLKFSTIQSRMDAHYAAVLAGVDNWNTAFGWGNHALAGYSTGAHFTWDYDYNDLINTPTPGEPNALHNNVNGEIDAIAVKAVPTTSDIILLEDAADSFSKKKSTLSGLPFWSKTVSDTRYGRIGSANSWSQQNVFSNEALFTGNVRFSNTTPSSTVSGNNFGFTSGNVLYATKTGVPHGLKIDFSALTTNRTITMPDADVDLSALGGGSTDYISNVSLSGTDLIFTGVGSAFNSTVSLASIAGGGDTSAWQTHTGSTLGGDLNLILGDHENAGNGTTYQLNDPAGYHSWFGDFERHNIANVFKLFSPAPIFTADRTRTEPDASGTYALEADPVGFDGNLTATDNTLQEIAQKFDDFVGGGLSNVVEDLTPDLGGNLGLNSKNITGNGNIDITGYISSTASDHLISLQGGVNIIHQINNDAVLINTNGIDYYRDSAGFNTSLYFPVTPIGNANYYLPSKSAGNYTLATTDDIGADDQTAIEVAFTPYSTIAATNVQDAIEEVVDEIPTSLAAANITVSPSIVGETDAYAVMLANRTSIDSIQDNMAGGVNTAYRTVTYSATISEAYDEVEPNIVITLTGNIDLTITGTANGDSGFLMLKTTSTHAINLNGLTDLSTTGNGGTMYFAYMHDVDGLEWFRIYKDLPAIEETIQIACSDLTTDITTGTTKAYFRMPYAATLTGVGVSLLTAGTTTGITVDINENGTTVLSTNLTTDATEKTSETATTPAVISDSSLAFDSEITIDFDAVPTSGKGVIIRLNLIRL